MNKMFIQIPKLTRGNGHGFDLDHLIVCFKSLEKWASWKKATIEDTSELSRRPDEKYFCFTRTIPDNHPPKFIELTYILSITQLVLNKE